MNVDEILSRLFSYYEVYTISELANKLGIKQPILSGWKSRKSINLFKKRCKELNIYNEIFENETQHSDTITSFLMSELRGCDISEDELQIELLKLIQKLKDNRNFN